MHKGRRYRMPVDDSAFARNARAAVTSKQEAEKTWEPKFIAEIPSGKDPRIRPGIDNALGRSATVADVLGIYRTRYVDVEPLKSRATIVSQLTVLTAELGNLPARALERRRERRITEAEELRLLDAARLLNEPSRGTAKLNWEVVREIRG